MGRTRAMSSHTIAVLRSVAEGVTYGFDIMEATRLPSGTVYPILSRVEDRGWVKGRWERLDSPREGGRPPRKYYALTPEGRVALQEAVERIRALAGPIPEEAS